MSHKLSDFADDTKYLQRIVANSYILETMHLARYLCAVTTLTNNYFNAGQYAEAVIQFQRVIDNNHSSRDKYRHLLAICYIQLDKYDEAAEILTLLYRKRVYDIDYPLSSWMEGRSASSFREFIYEDVSCVTKHYVKVGNKAVSAGDARILLLGNRGVY